MASTDSPHLHIGSIEHLGRRYAVTCRVAFDGIEFVGRLWFAEEDWDDAGLPDRAAIPGRTREEVIYAALGLRLIYHFRLNRSGRKD